MRTAGAIAGLLLAILSGLRAERLPLRMYTTADGLVNNSIHRIVRDSQGYLWFCTSEGLSRFDGHQFTSYGLAQGLPGRRVNDLLETRGGEYWLATSAGLARLRLRASPDARFDVFQPPSGPARAVNALLEEADGRILAGTDAGVYRLHVASGRFERIDLGEASEPWANRTVSALLKDARGNLWMATGSGLYRRRPDGRMDRWTETHHGLPSDHLLSLAADAEGAVWFGSENGLCRVKRDPAPGRPAVERCFTPRDGLPGEYVHAA